MAKQADSSRLSPSMLTREQPRGFLSPRGPTEEQIALRLAQEQMQREAQDQANAQGNEAALAIRLAQLQAQRDAAGYGAQQQLAGQNNQASMQRLVQGQRGDQAIQGGDFAGRMDLQNAAAMAKAQEEAAQFSRQQELNAADFGYKDTLMRSQAELAGTDPKARERE